MGTMIRPRTADLVDLGSFVIPQSTLLNGLVAWWKMEEASGNRLDSSGNGNSLVPSPVVAQVAGKIGQATGFSANGLLAHDGGALVSSGPFTFAGWIFITNLAVANSFMSQNVGGASVKQWLAVANDQTVIFSADGGTHSTNAGLVSASVWTFLAGVWDLTNLSLFVHGVLVDQQPGAAVFAGVNRFRVADDTLGDRLNGGAADLMGVWSRALTFGGVPVGYPALGEIAQLWNNGDGKDYPF